MFGDSVWAIVVVLGFVVLGAAIAYAKLNNRTTPEELRRTEEATRENYHRQSQDDAD